MVLPVRHRSEATLHHHSELLSIPVFFSDDMVVADRAFVDGILDSTRKNGFGNTLASVARSLPFTSGALLCAAREALQNRRAACAPVSGFHHAGYGHAGGFCTFNGLMVTSMVLHSEGLVRRVAILDLDQHWRSSNLG
jgi:acetoin utilization deacetylase AcuC-like enzyme